MAPLAATATRTRRVRVPRVSALTPTNYGQGSLLFTGPNWIGLRANNGFGFDILQVNADGQYQSIITDYKAVMQVFAWHLSQDGVLPKSLAGTIGSDGHTTTPRMTAQRKATQAAAVARRARAQDKVVDRSGD